MYISVYSQNQLVEASSLPGYQSNVASVIKGTNDFMW